ncbi:oligopeptide ABC transporter permease [Paenibacillus sp. R14(2021)]|uniref:oligopeptide ABC transporter permease n=1 Tax=Paenibacillus sp. R14(2021) TaxID=2859228 RepID=UPI00215757AB|nr:oligopeptide ABC transporter permease [Paenibacillus sp. R14(2021)]
MITGTNLFKLAKRRKQLEQDIAQIEARSFSKDAFVRFRKNKGAVFGVVVIAIIFVLALIGPLLSGRAYDHVEKRQLNLPPRAPVLENIGIFDGKISGTNMYDTPALENVYYWFGSDSLGRDLWTRVWKGTQISFLIAVIAVAVDVLIGISFGLISGYFGGKMDMVMQRFVEIINGIPNLVVVIIFAIILKPGIVTIILAIMITGWIGMSSVVRSQVMALKEQEFVLAAKTLGASHFKIIVKELLPNIAGQILVMSMFSIPSAIFYESFLAFVGLGLQPPQASLGVLISTGYQSLLTQPYLIVSPVIVLSLLMLSFNLISDGLRDALDTKMKHI